MLATLFKIYTPQENMMVSKATLAAPPLSPPPQPPSPPSPLLDHTASDLSAGGFDLMVTVGGVALFGVAEIAKSGVSALAMAQSGLYTPSQMWSSGLYTPTEVG